MINKRIKILISLALLILFAGLFKIAEGTNAFYSLNGDSFQKTSLQFNQLDQEKVLIIFNSGGWGNTPLEEAKDFAPVIEGIQTALREQGYYPVVFTYNRTKDNFLGKVEGVKEFLYSFQNQSEDLANQIEYFLDNNPGTKVIVTGLSAGGSFVNETMEKLSEKYCVSQNCDGNFKEKIYAIEAGIPFWVDQLNSENVLVLNNNRKDTLAVGRLRTLISTLIEAPGKWFLAKIKGENLAFSRAIQAPGHRYDWSSPEVGPEIVNFLKDKF